MEGLLSQRGKGLREVNGRELLQRVKGWPPAAASLRRENAEKRRYDTLCVHQDIFGAWGGIGSRRGNLKHYPCNDLAQVKKHIRRIICRRLMYVHT